MANRHHYVAQFHLRCFLDPTSAETPDPWLWVGDCADGEVRKRSPKNLGWERSLYSVPGAQSEPGATLEKLLAEKVEGPAAAALREYAGRAIGNRGAAPVELMVYLAWAAARTPTMRTLYQEWIDTLSIKTSAIEAPPEWLQAMKDRERPHHMEHPKHGRRDDVHPSEVEGLREDGWRFIMTAEDFGELLHVQAFYLGERHFPRLTWVALNAPDGREFIIADRPVLWGFDGALDVTSAALRDHRVQLYAPLTPKLVLMAVGPGGRIPERVTPEDVNRVMALGAQHWIAGASQDVVLRALNLRRG